MASPEHGEFVEVEFGLSDDTYPLVRISDELDCRIELLDAVQAADDRGTVTEIVRIESCRGEEVLEIIDASEVGLASSVIERFEEECVVEARVSQCVVGTLSDAGVLTRSTVVVGGDASIVALLPPDRAPAAVVASVKDRHPSISFERKRPCGFPDQLATRAIFQAILEDRFTEPQREALRLAYESGYFERPRERTQTDLAAEMEIASSTFSQHLHAAQRKLVATLFDEIDRFDPRSPDHEP